jgi:hypothetical protein
MGGGMAGGMGGYSGARPAQMPSMGGNNFGRDMNSFNRGGVGASGIGGGGIGNSGLGGLGAGAAGNAGLGQRPNAGMGQRPNAGADFSNRSLGGESAMNRYSSPSRNDLSSFLGLPSDEGFSHTSAASARTGSFSNPSTLPADGSRFDVNYGKTEGPRGGQAGGVTVTGPQGNTVGRAAAVGPQGGAAVVGGVQGAGGGTAVRGAAVGPNGQVAVGRGAVGPGGYGGGGIATAGPAGVAAGFTRVTPSGRYTAAAAVRGNYNNWGIYGRGWYTNYPGAWFAAGWTANAIWNAATWNTAASYCGYSDMPPMYYDYGNNITVEGDTVYVNGDSAGTTDEYYAQATKLASTGAEQPAAPEEDWLPLGVFAFTKADNPNSDLTIQLAVNKSGVIRGNFTDSASKKNQLVQGSVDKQTQRVAFTVGDNKDKVVETGLYNLTKEEAPCLVHVEKGRTEQWLLVRLKNPDTSGTSN